MEKRALVFYRQEHFILIPTSYLNKPFTLSEPSLFLFHARRLGLRCPPSSHSSQPLQSKICSLVIPLHDIGPLLVSREETKAQGVCITFPKFVSESSRHLCGHHTASFPWIFMITSWGRAQTLESRTWI